MEVLLSTFDAERTLDKLKKDKAAFANQLAELQLQNENDDSILKQTQIAEIMEYVEVRNAQIKEMEKHIKESNQGIDHLMIIYILIFNLYLPKVVLFKSNNENLSDLLMLT